MYGRHFDLEDELVSHISRKSIDLLKANYRVSLLPPSLYSFWIIIRGFLHDVAGGFLHRQIYKWKFITLLLEAAALCEFRPNEWFLFWPTDWILSMYRMTCLRRSGDWWWNWRTFSRYNEKNESPTRAVCDLSNSWFGYRVIGLICWRYRGRKRGREEGCSLKKDTCAEFIYGKDDCWIHQGLGEGMRHETTSFHAWEKLPTNLTEEHFILWDYWIPKFCCDYISRFPFLYEISDCEIVNLR